ncbi:RluA family pseudouridine synthase [Apilactobacillus kunkeei]|uniref:RluA family pseudouridine synthase n=1 Tax=Apilactobacillus kunkeei TaxID=148814 RepID=UPI0024CDA45D|nr:RluA family pseudouridine synthase [Apilactobacillus kunkeei]UZX32879.1 RluA family pseudouridine synthase [Apilactobacillus kunkeei]
MQFTWQNQDEQNAGIKKFLGAHGVSHRMYNDVKSTGTILVNGNAVGLDYKLVVGDEVTVIFPPETSDDEVAFSYEAIDVIYEDNNWLVVNKIAGLTSVPGPSNRVDTLVNRIKGYLKKRGSTDLRPHLITRLDRFTSGIVLVAKNRLANSLANQQVAQHKIDKMYYAVVDGTGLDEHGMIDKPIGRVGDNFRREVIEDGQNAKTEYWKVEEFDDATLVRLKLHTGRTHQIRVHMTSLGHPLLGDELYQGPLDRGIDRQALHAYYLEFNDELANQVRTFEIELPTDMKSVVKEDHND